MLEVKNLVKKYSDKYAVDDISFFIKDGEIVGFLGPNGAGKTTTMNILTGYLSATSGNVLVDGVDISEKPLAVKKNIGFLPETPPLYMDMTVYEYLTFVYELKGCDFNKEKHLREVCDTVKIYEVKDRLIRNLSKGYKQRVGIASAIIGNPKFIIFDEPTVGLDPKQIIEVRNLIRTLGKSHTVILSSHILSEVQAICDRILIINEGRIIADEKTSNLASALGQAIKIKVKVSGPQKEVAGLLRGLPGVTKVQEVGVKEGDAFSFYVEASNGIDIRKPMFKALAAKGWPIMGLENTDGELEEVFVRLIDKDTKGGK
ncbi:MAG: ATP-binding cassette domain-containing protein [Clostridia bacterium]|nr:ATP-binding cassette domain-containing protein [Clostridia bacterium]MBO5439365.1 ATP-binding cassette domain-containing protein [Clostridia bacterium]